MASFISYYTRYKRQIDEIVDATFWRLIEAEDQISDIMPIENYKDRDLLLLRINKASPTIASVVGIDQEPPLSRVRMIITEDLLKDCKLGKAYGMTAKDYEMLSKMEAYFERSGSGQEIATEIKHYFFGLFDDLATQIVNRATVMMMRVMQTASCTFNDPLTNARFDLTYPDTIPALLPPALSGGALWSASSTAQGLVNLRTLSDEWYRQFGRRPDYLRMRQFDVWALRDQDHTKRAYLSAVGATNVQPTDLPPLYIDEEQTIELIKKWTGIPDVKTFDSIYTEENGAGVITNRYYLDDGFVIMGEKGIYERSFTPTVERDNQPGIYSVAKDIGQVTKKEVLGALANMIPLCSDPRKICAMRVNNTVYATGQLS